MSMGHTQDAWAADVPISMPEAPSDPVLVDFLGFGFTTGGMNFSITEAELEVLYTPTFSPPGFQGVRGEIEQIEGDADGR